MSRHILLSRSGFHDPPSFDTAVSHAIVQMVGNGTLGESLRLHVASDVVAFGRQDVVAPGYRAAVEAALAAGFGAVERLAGGRAAVFTPGTLAFAWAMPTDDPRTGIHERFLTLSEIMASAFRSLGVDARVGEIPGEYCPGAFSVNARRSVKLMGVGQRLVRGAAHVGGVVVVEGADRIRDVLEPIYQTLDIDWDPRTVGDIAGEVPGVTLDEVAEAILAEFSIHAELEPWEIPVDVLERGRSLADGHLSRP